MVSPLFRLGSPFLLVVVFLASGCGDEGAERVIAVKGKPLAPNQLRDLARRRISGYTGSVSQLTDERVALAYVAEQPGASGQRLRVVAIVAPCQPQTCGSLEPAGPARESIVLASGHVGLALWQPVGQQAKAYVVRFHDTVNRIELHVVPVEGASKAVLDRPVSINEAGSATRAVFAGFADLFQGL